jgi:hypothetical protein
MPTYRLDTFHPTHLRCDRCGHGLPASPPPDVDPEEQRTRKGVRRRMLPPPVGLRPAQALPYFVTACSASDNVYSALPSQCCRATICRSRRNSVKPPMPSS